MSGIMSGAMRRSTMLRSKFETTLGGNILGGLFGRLFGMGQDDTPVPQPGAPGSMRTIKDLPRELVTTARAVQAPTRRSTILGE